MKEIKVEKYVYGMRLRGFAPGCQPLHDLVMIESGADFVEQYGRLYHNILTYLRPLTREEVDQYELDPLEA